MPTFRQLALKGRLRKRRRCTVAALKNSPQRKGIVIKMSITTPRKPNSAKRRYARVRVLASKKLISAHPPGLGSPYIQQFSIVMVEGGSPPDTPGINYSLIRGVYYFCMPEQYSRRRRRSKFGKKQPEIGFDPVRSKKDKLKILDSLLPQKKLDISERSEFYRSQYFALENYKRNLFLSILKREKRKLKRYIRKLEEKNKKPLGKDVITLLRKDMERRSTRMSKDRYDKSLNITGFLDRKQEKYKKMRKLFRKRLKQRSY
jgi:small subunit ribosomal protein S12